MATSLRVFALLVLGCTAFSWADESKFPEPPNGYSWKRVEKIKAAFLMPEGWHYHQEVKDGTFAFFITQEKIEQGKKFATGFSANVIRGRKDLVAADYAKRYVDKYAETRKLIKRWANKQGKLSSFGCQVVLPETKEGRPVTTLHILAIGNTATNTLYLFSFESPEPQWEEAWKKGEKILDLFMLDDEI